LLAKRAEDRYQSAQGLQYDLQHCWSQLQTQGTIETFSLGQCDRASQLLIPQKLYGRETEVQTLLNAFDSIHNNNSRLILISGYPGIGKTSLVKELYYPLLRSRGYLISGKFDQLKRDTPYAAIAEAFQSLIRQLLTATQRELTHWQQQLQTALGDNAQIIIDLIPEAEFLIGKQPAVTPLIGKAAQTRFYRVFQQFVGVFCQPQHPLVLFLDDLQWADLASLQLIENLLSEETIQSFLLIGAYRNNEVDITHPLLNLRQKIHNSEIPIDEIQIQSLHFDDVDNIIKDALKQETDQLSELKKLSNIIYQKTQGNPFFISQFLKTLNEENLIYYDLNRNNWNWDLPKIRRICITDGNIVELLVRNLKKLPKETQELLKLAACIGNIFNLETLAIINNQSISAITDQLWPALKIGLVFDNFYDNVNYSENTSLLENYFYIFLHDRIQQAAYSLIPEVKRKETHLRIGKLLLENNSDSQQTESLFTIANQLNLGSDLLTDSQEQETLAKLNLEAGQKAKEANAYELANDYLELAHKCLLKSCWYTQYELTIQIYLETTESNYFNTNFDRAKQLAERGYLYANTNFEQAKFLKETIKINLAEGDFDSTLENGQQALEILGISLVNFPPETISASELVNLPVMTNSSIILAMEILNLIYAPACFAESAIALPFSTQCWIYLASMEILFSAHMLMPFMAILLPGNY